MTAKAAFCLICLLMLTACDTVTTDNPIGASEATETDPQLIGTWKFVDFPKTQTDIGAAYAFFLPRRQGGFNTVGVAFAKDETDSGYYGLEIHTGKVGDVRFMNLIPKIDNGKPQEDIDGYWPVIYRFDDGGRLHVYAVSEDGRTFLENAIAAHRLAGTITEHPPRAEQNANTVKWVDIRITADQKSLDAFFGANAAQIFTQQIYTLRRVTMP